MRPGPEPDVVRELAEIASLEASGAIAELIARLDAPSWRVRRRVVDALAAQGDAAVGPLCDVLRDRRDDEGRIAAAVDALSRAVHTHDEPIVELARHPEPAIVADAVQVLGRARSPHATDTIVPLVQHPDDNVALGAIEALGRIGGRAAFAPLVAIVRGGHFFRAFPAIDVLGRTGDPRAVEPLAELLEEPSYALEAIRALGRTGDRGAVAPLVGLLIPPRTAPASLVRVVAVALDDLERRYGERFGDAEPVREALRDAADEVVLVRRLAAALHDADEPESAAIARVLGSLGHSAAEPHLLRLVDDRPAVAEIAAAALERVQGDADDRLREAIRTGTGARRRALLPRLARKRSAIGVLLACLTDPDGEVRALAADALAAIGDPRVVPELIGLLDDPNPRVAQAAIGAIQSLNGPESERLTIEALRTGTGRVRRGALRIIGYFGYPGAYDLVVETSRSDDRRLRDGAIQALGLIEHPGTRTALIGHAQATDPRDRAAALRAIGHLRRDPELEKVLTDALRDVDPWVRYYATQSIGRLRIRSAAQAIGQLLRDDAIQVRLAAIEALSRLGGADAFALLADLARSPDPETRRAALLGVALSEHPDAPKTIAEAVEDPDPATRLVAVSSLRDPAMVGAPHLLQRASRDADPNVHNAAVSVLADLPTADATQVLIALLRDDPSDRRVAAALSRPSAARIDGILDALDTADDELAPVLGSALVRMGTREAQTALLKAMALPNTSARRAVATLLAERPSTDAIAALQDAANNDPSEDVRQICAVALGRMA